MSSVERLLHLFDDSDTVFWQDGASITKAQFIEMSMRYAKFFHGESGPVAIVGGSTPDGLMATVGAAASGRDVLPLSRMSNGDLNDYLLLQVGISDAIDVNDIDVTGEEFSGFTTSCAPGMIMAYSAGSSGLPHVSSTRAMVTSTERAAERSRFYCDLIGSRNPRMFYAAPIMSGATVYVSMLSYGMVPFTTAKIPTSELMQSIVDDNSLTISTGRPSLVDRFIATAMPGLNGIETMVSAGQPLKPEHVEYFSSTGISRIVDTYSTTEAGSIAAREVFSDDKFTLFPGTVISNVTDSSFDVQTDFIGGYWTDGEFTETASMTIEDSIKFDGSNEITLVGRAVKKIKVSGFGVSTVVVETAARDVPGVVDAKLRALDGAGSSNILLLQVASDSVSEHDVRNHLSGRLPFYSIPGKIEIIKVENWGMSK